MTDEQEPARAKSRIDPRDITPDVLLRSRLKGPRADSYGHQARQRVGCSFASEGRRIVRRQVTPQQLRWGLNGIDMLEEGHK